MKEADLDFILRVLRVMSEVDCCDDLWWSTNGKCAPISFFINCNDLFWWATSDYEEITPCNIDELEKVVTDIKELADADADANTKLPMLWCTPLLFAARIRKMRPQGAYYKYFDRKLWALFDACGPERETKNDLSNTPKPKLTADEERLLRQQIQEQKKMNIINQMWIWLSSKFKKTNIKD